MDKILLKIDCDNGLSTYDLAEKYGKSQTTIRYWLKKFGLETRGNNGFIKSERATELNRIRWKSNFKEITSYDWIKIQEFYNNDHTYREICKVFNLNMSKIDKAKKSGLFIPRSQGETLSNRFKAGANKRAHTEESKEKMRISRKEYLKQNIDKHPWKNNDKFKSKPCETLIEKLKNFGLSFEVEYEPFADLNKYYCCDIAFPDKKFAIEVNGEQHYNRDKTLKKYYQIRHDFFESNGWKILELHYSLVYNNNIIDMIKLALPEGLEPPCV